MMRRPARDSSAGSSEYGVFERDCYDGRAFCFGRGGGIRRASAVRRRRWVRGHSSLRLALLLGSYEFVALESE